MDKSCGYRNIKELFLVDFKEGRIRLFIKFKTSIFQNRKKLCNRNFFHRISFRVFCFRLLNLDFKRMA